MDHSQLLTEIKNAVLDERKSTTKILHLLKQVEASRLYAERGYESLFSFVVKELGYSEAAAYRRISAMGALKELPQIETKILSGELSLTNIASAQSYFKSEAKNNKPLIKEEKIKLFETLENKSSRECEKILLSKSPEIVPDEKRRDLTETKTELKVILNQELIEQLDRLKQLWSHVNPNMTDSKLIEKMAQFCLSKIDPLKKHSKSEAPYNTNSAAEIHLSATQTPAPEPEQKSRYIPISTKLAVWRRDQGRCQYKDPHRQKICYSKHLIQIDHKFPWALGGTHAPENLQLLCATHNRLRAAKTFKKSEAFFK